MLILTTFQGSLNYQKWLEQTILELHRFIMAWRLFTQLFFFFAAALIHYLSQKSSFHMLSQYLWSLSHIRLISHLHIDLQFYGCYQAGTWAQRVHHFSIRGPCQLHLLQQGPVSASQSHCPIQTGYMSHRPIRSSFPFFFFAKEVAKKKLFELRLCFMRHKESNALKHNSWTVFEHLALIAAKNQLDLYRWDWVYGHWINLIQLPYHLFLLYMTWIIGNRL